MSKTIETPDGPAQVIQQGATAHIVEEGAPVQQQPPVGDTPGVPVDNTPATEDAASRIQRLKRAHAAGQDVMDVARETPAAQPAQDAPQQFEPVEDQVIEPGSVDLDQSRDEDAPTLDELAERFVDPYRTREGDPQGTYRDTTGRLRDQVTHRVLPGEARPDLVEAAPTAAEAPAEGEAEADDLIVELPPRREGEEPYRYQAKDQAEAERLRDVANRGMRREHFDRSLREVNEARTEVQKLMSRLEHDPEGVVLESIAEPTARLELARSLLLSVPEQEATAFLSEVAGLTDGGEYAKAALEFERSRGERTRDAEQRMSRIDTGMQRAMAINEKIRELTDPNLTFAQAEDVRQRAISILRAHIDRNNTDVSPDQVESVLRTWGLRGLAQPPAAGSAVRQPTPPQAAAATSPPSGPDRAASVPRARMVGDELRGRVERRQVAAATAPSGAGVGTTGAATPPAGQTLKERLAWARKAMLGR